MSYKKITTGLNTVVERLEHEAKWGGFNDPLPNMKEITLVEFATSGFFMYSLSGTEFRQIDNCRVDTSLLLSPLTSYINANIFYVDSPNESGFVLTNEYHGKKIRVFKFHKCIHEYVSLDMEDCKKLNIYHAGRCYHVSKCNKCGCVNSEDSSD